MNLLQRLSIRVRLFLLTAVPAVGALVLAAMIAQDARHRAASAEALGSVEDLATLSSKMSATVFALQIERARAAHDEGSVDSATRAALETQFRATDLHRSHLEQLLVRRDHSQLPPRLSRELAEARLTMGALPAFREKLVGGAASIDEILAFYGAIDESLIGATAALAQLSDDGQILRNISALVAVAELSERVSAEHALLANVATRKQFAPGMFKHVVALGTEQATYQKVFRANAPDDLLQSFDAEQQSESTRAALAMRDRVNLAMHRQDLEGLVSARTKELGQRNGAMRVVLDNIEQGIARVCIDGTILPERSAKFDVFVGEVRGITTFAEHLGGSDAELRDSLELGWESARDGIFPIDVALDQLPKRLERDHEHYTLGYRPIMVDGTLDGALLVVTDVTAEVAARREEEKQREHFAIFQRVAQDRDGFIAFCAEMEGLLDKLAGVTTETASAMGLLHTVKGTPDSGAPPRWPASRTTSRRSSSRRASSPPLRSAPS